MKTQSIMEDILIWTDGNKHYCEFTIDKSIADKYNLKVGDDIDIIEFFKEIGAIIISE